MANFGFLFLCCSLVNPESDLKLEDLFVCGTLYRFLEELEQKGPKKKKNSFHTDYNLRLRDTFEDLSDIQIQRFWCPWKA